DGFHRRYVGRSLANAARIEDGDAPGDRSTLDLIDVSDSSGLGAERGPPLFPVVPDTSPRSSSNVSMSKNKTQRSATAPETGTFFQGSGWIIGLVLLAGGTALMMVPRKPKAEAGSPSSNPAFGP